MTYLAAGAIAAGAVVGVGLVVGSRALKKLALRFEPDELHWATTEDGWELPLGRYRARGEVRHREPVILCHGMGANRFNLDLNERYSLARFLAARGWDAWVVELRACGLTRRTTKGRRYGHRFDDEVRQDVPAIIERVKALAGSERVSWVGHSKGGMIMYGWCGLAPRTDIAGVVAIGSPLKVAPLIDPRMMAALARVNRYGLGDAVYLAPAMRALAPFGSRVKLRYLAASDNLDPEIAAFAMANLLGNVSRNTLRQFVLWYETGRFTTWDGGTDYALGLARSPVPFLLIAGEGDRLVPPATVAAARDAMTSAEVEYVVASKANGFRCDYGHGDLVLGKCAPEEIFPRVEAWLARRGTRIAD